MAHRQIPNKPDTRRPVIYLTFRTDLNCRRLSMFRPSTFQKAASPQYGASHSECFLPSDVGQDRHAPSTAAARCKHNAIGSAHRICELAKVCVLVFRDFPVSRENAEGWLHKIVSPAASASLGLKSVFVDSQALDFCFQCGIGYTELGGGPRRSRYPTVTPRESGLDRFFLVRQQ